MFDVDSDIKSLYIHWPFCPYKCHFCPFVAVAGRDSEMEKYHEALCAEMQLFAKLLDRKIKIETIYCGGGTPSTYPDNLLLDMFGKLREMFDCSQVNEITLEVNPGTVTLEKINTWVCAGITRLSLGVQSANDKVLMSLNRNQTISDVRCFLKLSEGKFDSISIDLIIGLPGVSDEEWREFIFELIEWPIMHVSIYFLSIHENTQLYFKVKNKQIVLPPDDAIVDLYYWTVDTLEKAGFMQYEVSNFAKEGYESLHNKIYWDRKSYKGFGLGACSFDGASRFQNEKNLMKYINANGNIESCFSEKLSYEDVRLERIMLGLRRREGVLLDDIYRGVIDEKQVLINNYLHVLIEKGYVKYVNDRLIILPHALALENEIAVALSL